MKFSSTPSYRQSTATECGIACLGFVASHHGFSLEMRDLRARYAISMRGTSLAELVRIANSLLLRGRAVKLKLEDLPKLSMPCVLHWNMSHFVVLKKIKRGELHIFDPARGFLRLKLAEASPHFTGIALELTPTADFVQLAPAPPINWRQLVGRVHGLKRSLGQMLLLAASLQLFLLIIPLFTQWIVDQAIVAGDFELLGVLIIGFSFITLIKIGLEAARSWLGIVASAQFGMQWSAKVMAHLLRLPLQWFEVRYSGDVISRFQSLQAIQQTVTGKLVEIFLDAIFAVVVLLVMLLYSTKLTLVVLLAVVGYAAIRILPHGAYHRLSDEVLVQEAKAQTHFIESLRAIQVVKISRLEEQRAANWLNMIVGVNNQRTKSQAMLLAFTTG